MHLLRELALPELITRPPMLLQSSSHNKSFTLTHIEITLGGSNLLSVQKCSRVTVSVMGGGGGGGGGGGEWGTFG